MAFDVKNIFGGTSSYTRNPNGTYDIIHRGPPGYLAALNGGKGPIVGEKKGVSADEARADLVDNQIKSLRDFYDIEAT